MPQSKQFMKKIFKLRKQIDAVDLKILKLIALRRKLAREIGKTKKTYKLPIQDKKRELFIIKSRAKITKKLKLPQKLTSELFKIIMSDSKLVQNRTANFEANFDKKS